VKKIIFIVFRFRVEASDGSGSKIFDPGRVNFLWLGSGWVSHLWFGFEYGKFPLKMSNFSIFCPSGRVRGRSASYLLHVKSKLGTGHGPSLVEAVRLGRKVPFYHFIWLIFKLANNGSTLCGNIFFPLLNVDN